MFNSVETTFERAKYAKDRRIKEYSAEPLNIVNSSLESAATEDRDNSKDC